MEYVINHGMDYEELEAELFTDKMLIPDTNDGYTGLVFERRTEDTVYWYCNYIDGYKEGICIDFYEDGSIRGVDEYTRNLRNGEYKKFDESGNLVEGGECCYGVHLNYKKYDAVGNILEEKNKTTKQEDNIIRILKEGITNLKENKDN